MAAIFAACAAGLACHAAMPLTPPAAPAGAFLPGLASLGDFATSHAVAAGLPPEATHGLLASIAATHSAFADVAAARYEHSLSTAADAEARAAIRAGGMTPERSDALDAAETRLAAATAALDVAESDLRDIAHDALVARVGAENALLARRVAANASRRVPDAWRALDLPPDHPGWQTLESAWFKARRGLSDGVFTQEERAALAAVQSDATVALVQQRLDANLASVQAAWLQFMQHHAAAE